MPLRISCLIACLIIFSSSLIAQGQKMSFTVKGKVVDESSNQPLEFATITIKKMRDSSLVAGTITNKNGEFSMDNVPPGGMQIEIAFIGYEKVVKKLILKPQEALPINDLGDIKLKVSAKLLEGAEITAEKSFVINQIDKKTYNTDQLSVAQGGNVQDILVNIPSVEVDAEGTVSLRGNQNVTILIDGRPSGMATDGGKSLLESIPASAIENIEVITNPSAKYDPDGISGIINIVTKKNKLQGFTGSIGVNTSFENRYGGNLSLAYKKGKWNLYTLYGYNKRIRDFEGNSYKATYFSEIPDITRQIETNTDESINQNVKFGVDFNINDHNTISSSVLYNFGNGDEDGLINYYTTNEFTPVDSLYKRTTLSDEDNKNLDFDLSWMHYFKQKGRTLNFLATGSLDKGTDESNFKQQGYIDENTPVSGNSELQQDREVQDNKIYTTALDYEHPIGEDKKIEAGYKSTFRNFDTDYAGETFDYTTGQFENDTNLTNQFLYNDQLHALYAQYRQSINKFGFQLGVRSEYATTESKLVTTNESFNKDYFSVFPSAFVTYKPGEKSQIKATYSRRISRPSQRSLNPFANYEDPENIRKGNPFLDPEYTDSYELEYSRMLGSLSFIATGYARLTTDYIQRYRSVQPDGITVTTYENLASEKNYGLEMILNGSPYKWWTFTLSSNIYRNEIDATNIQQELSSTSLSVSGRIFTTFTLPYKTEFQVSYFYHAPSKVPQGEIKEMHSATIALSKKVLKDKGVITARLSDPFNTQRFRLIYESETFYQDFTRKRQSRFVTLSFTYRFGELKDRDTRQRREQAPQEDMDF